MSETPKNGADVRTRMITPGQLAQMLGARIENALQGITGSGAGEEPAFAFVLWIDGQPEVHYMTNRGTDELAKRCMGVLTHLAQVQPEAEKPMIVLPS